MNKILVITGGSSGIGFATAKLFQNNGFKIINLSKSSINLDQAVHFEVDLSNTKWQKSVKLKFNDLLSSADKICLIHNASKMQSDNVESLDVIETTPVPSFNDAFLAARNELGPGNTFEWNGNLYSTNYADEVFEGLQSEVAV